MGDLSDLLYMVDAVKFARERLDFDPDARGRRRCWGEDCRVPC
jgi:hypothetical protein